MTGLDVASLAAVWGLFAPAAVYATARLVRLMDKHIPMPDGM